MQINKEKLIELQEKVKQWSFDRGITINGKSTTQMLKLVSEISEIFESYLEKNKDKSKELLKDAIGDSLVVIINLVELIKKEAKENGINIGTADLRWCNAEKNLDKSTEEIKNELIVLIGELSDAVGKTNYSEAITLLNSTLKYLNYLSEIEELTLDECLDFAYNEIKDRHGFLNENGNFIKSTDLNYKKLYNEFLERNKK